MLTLTSLSDLKSSALPPPVAQAAHHELQTLLALSGGETCDTEYGYVLVLERTDAPNVVASLLRRPIEGAVRRHECFVVYFGGGGNEHLPCAVLPEHLLTEEHRHRLRQELTDGGAP